MFPLFLCFTFITAFVVSVLIYVRKCHTFWRGRGVPSTSPSLLFGDIGSMVLGKRHICFVQEDIYRAFPNEKFVGFYEFAKPNLLIKDPRLIESVLVKDFSHFTDRMFVDIKAGNNRLLKHLFMLRGKQWKDLRTRLVTTFSTNKLKSMLLLMDGCAQIMDSLVQKKCEEEWVDMKEVVSRFATDVIGCCVFGLHFNTLTEPESAYRKIGKTVFRPSFRSIVVGTLRTIAPKLVALLRLNEFSADVQQFFVDLLAQSEEFRKKESIRRNDLMQLILDIRDRDREATRSSQHYANEIIDDDIVVANVFAFYAAGFETTASTLAYCFYELALNPQIQERLRKEVREALWVNDEGITYQTLKKMTYAEMVICETLRKYTPVAFLMRACTLPYQLPGTPLQLIPGDRITIPVHCLHRDENYYPNPDKFDPERFTPENIAARPTFTYMPFGDGPRMCLAIRFAKMEMKLCLARIISKYEFKPNARTEIPLQIHPRAFLLSPKNGVYLQVQRLSEDKII